MRKTGRKPKYIDEDGNYDAEAMMETARKRALERYHRNKEEINKKRRERYKQNNPWEQQQTQRSGPPGHYIVTPNFIMEIVG